MIQIAPGIEAGVIKFSERRCPRIAAWMILPGEGGTIACSLGYFQRRASLRNQWIDGEGGRSIELSSVGGLGGVVVSVVKDGVETECRLPEGQAGALLRYFMMDVGNDAAAYEGFDCYAFASLMTDSLFMPDAPPFDFEDRPAKPGEIVVAANGPELPGSIRHWALCVGDDAYLSKLGQTGQGAQALLDITDRQGMLTLYECDRTFVATRRMDAPPWDDGRWPLRV